jgi:energy-coupling factor transport system substrate-specific component
MENQSLGRLFVGKWNAITFVSVVVGAALFGVLMVFGSIPVFTNTYLSSAMIVPVVVGGIFGSLPASATMLFGNMITGLVADWGFRFDWSIGNGVLGLFIGALPLYGAKIDKGTFTVKHAIIYAVLCVIGNAIAFGIVTPILTSLLYPADLELSFIQAFVSIMLNVAVLTIVGIPLLFLLANRFRKQSNLKEEEQ